MFRIFSSLVILLHNRSCFSRSGWLRRAADASNCLHICNSRPGDPFAGPVGAELQDRRVGPGQMRPGGRAAGPEDGPGDEE